MKKSGIVIAATVLAALLLVVIGYAGYRTGKTSLNTVAPQTAEDTEKDETSSAPADVKEAEPAPEDAKEAEPVQTEAADESAKDADKTADAAAQEEQPAYDLEYWTEGSKVADSIREYVAAVSDESSSQFIPEEDRIAVFDMDGTFVGELFPTYVDTCMFVYRVLEDESYTPDEEMLSFAQMVRAAMNDGTIGSVNMKDLAQHFARCYSDLSVSEFQDYVRAFKTRTPEGFANMTYGTSFYKPMISVIHYLAANGFQVYVVSGTERMTARALVEDVIGDVVPPSRVIGSDFTLTASNQGDVDGLEYTYADNDVLNMGDALMVKNLKMNKVTAIAREIGKVPVLAFGNSTGDFAMAQYALSNDKYETRAYMLLCDDTDRDYGNPEKAASFKEKCDKAGYITVSMKDDFATIFGEDVRLDPSTRPTAAPDNVIDMPQKKEDQKKAS